MAQALLCSFYIRRICGVVCAPHMALRTFATACMVLMLGSGLGWYAARVIPDVFTGIGLLAVYMLVGPGRTAWSRVLDGAVFVAACWFHTSNLLILPIAGAVLMFIRRRDGAGVVRKGVIALVIINPFAWGGLMLANKVLDGEAFCAAYRAGGGVAPVILLTAASDAVAQAAVTACGAAGYISKPFDLDRVLAMVALHLPTTS